MRKGFRQDLCMWIFTQAAGKEANGFSISAPPIFAFDVASLNLS